MTETEMVFAVRRLRAMNTDIELRTANVIGGSYLGAAAQVFTDVDHRFSRFRPDSELSLLNARTTSTVHGSPDLLALLMSCACLHRVTRGVFDPSILPDLEASGYDRSFELMTGDAGTGLAAHSMRGFDGVAIDHAQSTITLPDGMRIDLGGIGKGWAVDRAAEVLAPCEDFVVNAGGDVFAAGSDGYHDGWTAAIEHPHTGETISTVVLRNEAIATSTTARRNWLRAGERHHHLIDPRTGTCSQSGVAAVSVIGTTTVEADVFAKSALILGAARGREFLDDVSSPGLFVLDDGSVRTTTEWPAELNMDGGVACSDAWR